MSHEVDLTIAKTGAFWYTIGISPWHTLGEKLEGESLSAEELIANPAFGFEVEGRPYFMADGKQSKFAKASVRTDTGAELGSVGTDYEFFQNREAAEFIGAVSHETGMPIKTAGMLRGGAEGFLMMRLPSDMVVGKGNVVSQNMGFRWSHDGSIKLSAFGTMIDIVCYNTAELSLGMAQKKRSMLFALRHTSNLRDRIAEAKNAVVAAITLFKEWGIVANKLAAAPVSDTQADTLLRKATEVLLPGKLTALETLKRSVTAAKIGSGIGSVEDRVKFEKAKKAAEGLAARREKLLDTLSSIYYVETANRANLFEIPNNAYVLYSAVSDYVEREQGRSTPESHLSSILWGTGAERKAEVWGETQKMFLAQ